ncbi:MAG: LPS-assembly protein LptD [Nitrospiraceae bacterium]
MGHRPWSVLGSSCLVCLSVLTAAPPPAFPAQSSSQTVVTATPPSAQPLEITGDRIEYHKETEAYEADGSVVIVQGPMKLTADHVTLQVLPGTLIATGRVHLLDGTSELWSEQLELDVNTEAGVITDGRLYNKLSNTLVTGRLLQRFSEDHYRIKDGTFTNCDAREGQIPAWRFRFKDMDLNVGESLFLKDAWFCVNDVPLIPLPTFTYPIQTTRKSGFLVPNAGYDNRFGMLYRQSYFWAFSPSQDLTITPDYKSDLGYGGDLEYRYVLDRKSKGQWLLSFLLQQELPNVSGVEPTSADAKRTRGMVSGSHTQQVNPDLLIRAQAFLVSDPDYLQQLSNSGASRALPSGESNLDIRQRFTHGNLYLLGQYLQPLGVGGEDTFQRLPEIGHNLVNAAPFRGPVLLGMENAIANFYRDEGFRHSRADVMPALSTDALNIGHVIAVTPQVRPRGVFYTRGVTTQDVVHRETFWASLDATSRLTRRFSLGEGASLLHTIEPDVIYEYVPPTDQSKIVQVDDRDDLPKKNLVTYSIRSRLLEMGSRGTSNWLDLTLAQSYHPGSVQTQARDFFATTPFVGTATQPLQPATTPVQGRKFSDIWTRAVIGNPSPSLPTGASQVDVTGAKRSSQLIPVRSYLTIDTFFDPYRGTFSQFNTDLRFQAQNRWYVEVGQRYTRDGNRVRRGDIWNPISFGDVFAPTQEIQYVTASAAVRTPLGWTLGAKTYYDVKDGKSPEWDLVGLYQNPCKCWSLGIYYLQFPDRVQYNFMVSLTGVGWTENFGTAVMRSILEPLLIGERGLPWPAPGGPYGRRPPVSETPPGPVKP